jgi:hypothetical protein
MISTASESPANAGTHSQSIFGDILGLEGLDGAHIIDFTTLTSAFRPAWFAPPMPVTVCSLLLDML